MNFFIVYIKLDTYVHLKDIYRKNAVTALTLDGRQVGQLLAVDLCFLSCSR